MPIEFISILVSRILKTNLKKPSSTMVYPEIVLYGKRGIFLKTIWAAFSILASSLKYSIECILLYRRHF